MESNGDCFMDDLRLIGQQPIKFTRIGPRKGLQHCIQAFGRRNDGIAGSLVLAGSNAHHEKRKCLQSPIAE